jgi:hypothetical protein
MSFQLSEIIPLSIARSKISDVVAEFVSANTNDVVHNNTLQTMRYPRNFFILYKFGIIKLFLFSLFFILLLP